MERILRNAIRCTLCGDIVESESVHDFKQCSCGACAVDGGREYLRRCFTSSPQDYEDLSVVESDAHDDTALRPAESNETFDPESSCRDSAIR